MAFAKARTALAQIEEKLRRQFGLAGEVGASLNPAIVPVVITGDLRDAGNAANQGRAFAWAYTGPIGVGFANFQSLRTEQDVFLDYVVVGQAGALAVCSVWITVPSQAPAVAPVALAGTWTDKKLIAGDQVPLTQGVPGALTGTNVSDQNRILGVALANDTQAFRVNIMLPAGAALNFTGGGAMIAGCSGRIWP